MTKRILRYLCALMYKHRNPSFQMETRKFPNGYRGEINKEWLAQGGGRTL